MMSGQAADVWSARSMNSKRAVLAALITVPILPSGDGKARDSETVPVL